MGTADLFHIEDGCQTVGPENAESGREKGQIHMIGFTLMSLDCEIISKKKSELIFTDLLTLSVLFIEQFFCRYYSDIGNLGSSAINWRYQSVQGNKLQIII
jgi:hypothetical protein